MTKSDNSARVYSLPLPLLLFLSRNLQEQTECDTVQVSAGLQRISQTSRGWWSSGESESVSGVHRIAGSNGNRDQDTFRNYFRTVA